jgi:phosphoribosylformimino-5-aminoimidazole carboxamide ribotide isomerase
MKIYPAIDLYNDRVVRLQKGDYQKMTDYGNPVDTFKEWYQKGIRNLHVVDLSGAKQEKRQLDTIKSLIKEDVFIQVGGGIRTYEAAKELLSLGVNQIILGTVAIKNPKLLRSLVEEYPDKITVGIDALDGIVKVNGWLEDSQLTDLELIKNLEHIGVKRIIYTDISKDGMLEGPNTGKYKQLLELTTMEIVASGGVSSIKDVTDLKTVGVDGVIVGKALYENRTSIEELLLC